VPVSSDPEGAFSPPTSEVICMQSVRERQFQTQTEPEAEFLDVIKTKVLRVFLLPAHSHLYLRSKSGWKLVCNAKL